MELVGKLIVINDTETVGSGSFTKRECVVETVADKYPQKIKVEFVKDKTSLLDAFAVGDSVKIEFNLKGNEFNGKYYVSLTGWKIEAATGVPSRPPATAPRQNSAPSNTRQAYGQRPAPASKPAPRAPVVDEDVPF